ncbi:MAG: TetR/AcrR family transcriptional regulator [Acidobacteriota bacterium]
MTETEDTPRRRDPEATRVAILDAAEALFIESGTDAVPISQIARQAGVTKSLIHHHFGSKDQLWDAIKERRFTEYFEQQAEILQTADAEGVEVLEVSMRAYFNFLRRNPNMVKMMALRFVEEDDTCAAMENDLFRRGVERIEESQARGEIRADLNPFYIIKSFIALSLSWFQSKPMFCATVGETDAHLLEDERYLEDAVAIFLEGVRPRPTNP